VILFLSHEASRTGAPLMLWQFLQYFKENSSIPFEIGVLQVGELMPDFQEISPTFMVHSVEYSPQTLKQHLVYRVKKSLGTYQTQVAQFLNYLKVKKVKLIYSNTLVNGHFLEQIADEVAQMGIPILVHAHELEHVIQIFQLSGQVAGSLKYGTHFIACSEAVRQNLIQNHSISAEKITTVHSFSSLDSKKLLQAKTQNQSKKSPELSIRIMACGTFDWRKGADLFIQLAKQLASEKLQFVWVGGDELSHQLFYPELAEKQEFIHFISHTSAIESYFAQTDIFLLLSREEPLGRVALEAGLMKIPVLCFENSGFAEIITSDTGFALPLGNLDEMAKKITFLQDNPQIRKEMGENLYQNIQQNFTLEISAQKIIKVIDSFL